MYRCVLLTILAMVLGQCDFGNDNPRRESEPTPTDTSTPNPAERDEKKVAELSFADSGQLNVEVGEKFDITVKVANINTDNVSNDLDWTDHRGEPMDREGEPDWSSLRVTSRLLVKGKGSNLLRGGYSDTRVEGKGGTIKIEGFYFSQACEEDCRIVFGLRVSGMCMEDSGCEGAQVEPVDEISKAVVVKPSSYALKLERLSGKNIKLTVTKDGVPLANKSAKVYASVECEQRGNPWWFGCAVPHDLSLINFDTTINLDANGSWSTELDADGSWLKKAREAKSDYELDVCKVKFDISVEGREFDNLTATGGGC